MALPRQAQVDHEHGLFHIRDVGDRATPQLDPEHVLRQVADGPFVPLVPPRGTWSGIIVRPRRAKKLPLRFVPLLVVVPEQLPIVRSHGIIKTSVARSAVHGSQGKQPEEVRPFRSSSSDAGQEHEVLAPHCRPLQSAIDPQHGLELLLDDPTRANLGDELLVATLQLNHVASLLPAEEVAGADLLLVELVRHGQVHLGAPLVHQPRDLLVELVVVPVDGLPVLAIVLGVHLRVVDELTHLEVVPVVPDELTRSQRLVPEQVELPAIGKPPFRCHECPQAVAQELNGVPNLLLIPVLNQTLELEDPLLEPAHDGDSANHHLASLRPVELASCEAFRDVGIRLR